MKSPLRSDTMVVIGAGSQQGVAIHQRAVLLDGAGTPQERGELRLTKVDKNRTIGVARDWCVLHESDHVLFEP